MTPGRVLVVVGAGVAAAATALDRGDSTTLALVAIGGLIILLGGVVLLVRDRRRTQPIASDGSSARVLADRLATGAGIDPLEVWGLILQPGEAAYLDAEVSISWLTPTGWTPPMPDRAIVTDRRIVLRDQEIWWSAISRLWPDTAESTISVDLVAGPSLRLSGPDAAVVGVYATWVLHGADGLARHPGLAALRD